MRSLVNGAMQKTGLLILLLGGAFALVGQTDMTGYWIVRYKDAGVTYLQLAQTGEAVQSVASGRGGGGGRGAMSGTLHNGKLEMKSVVNRPPAAPGAVVPPARETVYEGTASGLNRFQLTVTTTGRAPATAILERVSMEEAIERSGKWRTRWPRAEWLRRATNT